MGDLNVFVSNGTCYSAAGERLHESFIPCGNAALGHQTCCRAGDNCLMDNSCFGIVNGGVGYGSFLTYMAGCTDPDYRDPSCPKKEFDQPWIALTHCTGSNGAWAPCSQVGNPTTLQNGAQCSCTDASKTTLAFRDTDPITSTASLPGSVGGSISFFDGHTPSPPPAGSGPPSPTTAATNPGSVPTGNNPTTGGSASQSSPRETGTAPSNGGSSDSGSDSGSSSDPGSSSGSGGLAPGAKIALAVGITVIGLLIIAGIISFILLRRRRERRRDAGVVGKQEKGEVKYNRPTTPRASEADSNPVSEADGKAARPWSMRSELEGSQVGGKTTAGPPPVAAGANGAPVRKSAELSPVAELPGNDSWYNKETQTNGNQR